MKKLIILLFSIVLFSCTTQEEPNCNCQVIELRQTKEITPGLGIISGPFIPYPSYDTIVDCSQNGVEWTKVIETIEPPTTYIETRYKRIKCN